MEMNDEESQKLKQMMQDSERRKVLQKKGVSYKNSQAAHQQDLDRKSKKHLFKEAIKIEDATRVEPDGVAVHRSQQVKKNRLLLRNSEYDFALATHDKKPGQDAQLEASKMIKNFNNQQKRPKVYEDGHEGDQMENKVGDPAEQGLSGEHREDLQMQIKQ